MRDGVRPYKDLVVVAVTVATAFATIVAVWCGCRAGYRANSRTCHQRSAENCRTRDTYGAARNGTGTWVASAPAKGHKGHNADNK